MIPRCPQDAPRCPQVRSKMPPGGSKMPSGGSKMSPRCPQVRSKMPPRGSKKAQDAPKMPPRVPKMHPRTLEMHSRCPEMPPNACMCPNLLPNYFYMLQISAKMRAKTPTQPYHALRIHPQKPVHINLPAAERAKRAESVLNSKL